MNTAYICHSYIPGGNLSRAAVEAIDFHKITHTNIAFASVEEDDCGHFTPYIDNKVLAAIQLVLEEIARQGASSRVLISIGGWGAGNFCEASATDENREAFAQTCLEYLKTTGIHGIDLDWEYPGRCAEVISACKHCKTDYIALCKTVRRVIGDGYLLTSAVGSHLSRDMDYAQLNEVFDYVNVMTYDMGKTAHSHYLKTVASMRLWARSGFKKSKLVLGVPFYARSADKAYDGKGYADLMALADSGNAVLKSSKYQEYVVVGNTRMGIDTPASIAKKVRWVKKNGFGGVFNWQETTDRGGELRAAMWSALHEE